MKYGIAARVLGTAMVAGGFGCPAAETPADKAPKQDEKAAPASKPAAAKAEAVDPSAILGAKVGEAEGITVYKLQGSRAYADAKLSLAAPKMGAKLPSGKVAFDFEATGYELGQQTDAPAARVLANSGKGQHIHLIVDNDPYSAHYTADFDREIADGTHVALAFLSRSYHESVKGTHVVRTFTVGEPSGEPADLSAPHLFYSRPKGTYTGAGAKYLMLDFYLVNTTIGPDGNKVRATINGAEFMLTDWVPYVIVGLPMGEAKVQLELIDAEGKPVPGPFNSVTRSVTLQEG
jgi:hypothetical protein